ncbi:MAG: hypothetical protein MK324_01995 [Pirellulales bacterium]|nr:hypothetical protein [Pirellulales bacterium]
MSAAKRASLIKKTFTVLKKQFPKVQLPVKDRPILEQLLYACCLENSTPDQATEAFSKVQTRYVDWNEVRVTTVSELTEVMGCLPRAAESARNLRRVLFNVYETHFSFDLSFMAKEGLSKATATINGYYDEIPKFVVNYTVQNGLGGHAIPLSDGALDALEILDIVTPKGRQSGKVAGLERTIAKNKGVEFGSLLHMLGTQLAEDPYGKKTHDILLKINKDCTDSLPVKPSKKSAVEEKEAGNSRKSETAAKKGTKKKAAPAKKKAAPAKNKAAPAKKKVAPKKKKATPKKKKSGRPKKPR